jgi:hypothetical protein
MPITLRALAQDHHTLRIDYGAEGDLNIVYTPSLITEKLLAQMSAISATSEMPAVGAAVNDTLARLVQSWDLTGDDGAVIPLTPEALVDIPLMVRVDILSRLVSDMRLGEQTGTPSKTPSRKRS